MRSVYARTRTHYFALGDSFRNTGPTTNGLERLNEAVKRRTRVVRIFPNPETCLRLVTALCIEQSEEWLNGRRYLDMSEPCPLVEP